jgi:hypothetical protein
MGKLMIFNDEGGMPKASTKRKSSAAPKRRTKRVNHNEGGTHTHGLSMCTSCDGLPAGTVEIVSLLLVLVFSLTAVLMTSVSALDSQQTQIDLLEAQLKTN